jgi:hypothetical protein
MAAQVHPAPCTHRRHPPENLLQQRFDSQCSMQQPDQHPSWISRSRRGQGQVCKGSASLGGAVHIPCTHHLQSPGDLLQNRNCHGCSMQQPIQQQSCSSRSERGAGAEVPGRDSQASKLKQQPFDEMLAAVIQFRAVGSGRYQVTSRRCVPTPGAPHILQLSMTSLLCAKLDVGPQIEAGRRQGGVRHERS